MSISPRARCFRPKAAPLQRSRAHARRAAMAACAAHHLAAGAARDRRRPRARAARDAQRHRRQRISRRADPDALDLHHLAQPRKPAGRGADRLPHAGDRRGADRARTLRPAAAGLCRARHTTASWRRGSRSRGRRRWLAAGACFLPVVLGFLLPAGYLAARSGRARAAGRLRPESRPPCADHCGARLDRDRDRAGDRLSRRSRRCATRSVRSSRPA